MSLIQDLSWRYATKKMTGEPIGEKELQNILEATRLSASSFGLQPYTILVVSNPDIKEKLRPAAYGQEQITESSHLLVFTVWNEITPELVQEYINNVAAKRGLQPDALVGFRDTINGAVNRMTPDQQRAWAAKQAYIALGTALAAAAEAHVDATPMEGFDTTAFDEILGLPEKGLRSVVIMALGKRNNEDFLAHAPKVRRDSSELFSYVA